MANKIGTIIANAAPAVLISGVYFGLFNPNDWKALWNPCNIRKAKVIFVITYNMVAISPVF